MLNIYDPVFVPKIGTETGTCTEGEMNTEIETGIKTIAARLGYMNVMRFDNEGFAPYLYMNKTPVVIAIINELLGKDEKITNNYKKSHNISYLVIEAMSDFGIDNIKDPLKSINKSIVAEDSSTKDLNGDAFKYFKTIQMVRFYRTANDPHPNQVASHGFYCMKRTIDFDECYPIIDNKGYFSFIPYLGLCECKPYGLLENSTTRYFLPNDINSYLNATVDGVPTVSGSKYCHIGKNIYVLKN